MKRCISILLLGCFLIAVSVTSVAAEYDIIVSPNPLYWEAKYGSYETFETAINTSIYESFVPYPAISFFGDLTAVTAGPGCYEYSITDANGFQFTLRGNGGYDGTYATLGKAPVGKEDPLSKIPEDLRRLDPILEAEFGKDILIYGCGYYYAVYSNLWEIYIQLSEEPSSPDYGHYIVLQGLLHNYPTDGEETMLSRLLSKDTFTKALEEIRSAAIVVDETQDAATGKTARTKRIILGCAIGVGVIAIATPVTVMAVRRKKKKAAAGGGEADGGRRIKGEIFYHRKQDCF